MIDDIELAVVGAGPAGIEAATTAALAGVEVALIDSSPKLGGQFFQQMPDPFQCDDHSHHHAKSQQLLKRLESTSVHLLTDTLVWGIFEGVKPDTWCLTLHGPDAPPAHIPRGGRRGPHEVSPRREGMFPCPQSSSRPSTRPPQTRFRF